MSSLSGGWSIYFRHLFTQHCVISAYQAICCKVIEIQEDLYLALCNRHSDKTLQITVSKFFLKFIQKNLYVYKCT